jgi:hypothetical protein
MLTWFLVQVFLNSVAHLRQACSGKGGFETRPYICCSGTSTSTINAPPRSRGRFQTCPPLKQALDLPFPGGSCFPKYVAVLMKYRAKPEDECFLKRSLISHDA